MKTDSEIQHDVKEELMWEPSISSKEINVDVKNGFVTLTGSVDSYSKKIAAQSTTERVTGVTGLTNNIAVNLPSIFEKSDSDIEKTVHSIFKWSNSVPDDKIKVQVKDGWVTLEGDVAWAFQKRAATRIAEDLTGVKGVTNSINIATALPATSGMKAAIEAALKRNININGEKVNVNVSGGKVTLSGKVRSFSEKFNAENAAWSASGINSVENDLEVIPSEVYA